MGPHFSFYKNLPYGRNPAWRLIMQHIGTEVLIYRLHGEQKFNNLPNETSPESVEILIMQKILGPHIS